MINQRCQSFSVFQTAKIGISLCIPMPWIEVVSLENAKGLLKKEYKKAIKRAGLIWNVVGIMSQNPRVLKTSMELYGASMFGDSPLSRSQREMLATVVSAVNHCVY